jgi:hypothetical protein
VNYTASTDSTISEQLHSPRRPGFDTSQIICDLWRTKWHWDMFSSEYFDFPMSVSSHSMLHIESSINPSMNHSIIHTTIHSAHTLHISAIDNVVKQYIFTDTMRKTMTNLNQDTWSQKTLEPKTFGMRNIILTGKAYSILKPSCSEYSVKRLLWLWGTSSLLSKENRWSLPSGCGGQSVKLTAHFHPIPRLIMRGAMPLPTHILSRHHPVIFTRTEIRTANARSKLESVEWNESEDEPWARGLVYGVS